MHQYTIAGLSVGVSGGGLNHIPGFSTFSSTYDKKNIEIIISLGETPSTYNSNTLYSFIFNERTCEFSHSADGYFLRMVQPDGNHLLMEMKFLEKKLFVSTNMDENTPSHWLRFAVWLAFGIFSVTRQIVAIHASTVIYKGKAILFLGESGTGKSTHTRLWLKNIPDTELLNDDSPLIHADKKNALAFGSPWSGKTPCYKNKFTSIAGIVRLSQAPHNKITKLNKLSAIGALLPSCPPALAYDECLSDKVCDILSSLILQVPVYSLECTPDVYATQLVYSTLKKEGCI